MSRFYLVCTQRPVEGARGLCKCYNVEVEMLLWQITECHGLIAEEGVHEVAHCKELGVMDS